MQLDRDPRKRPEIVNRVLEAAFPEYTGTNVYIQFKNQFANLDSYWSGGSRDYYAVVALATMRVLPIPQNGTPFDNLSTSKGFTTPYGFVVVRHQIAGGKDLGITIYTAENNLLQDGVNQIALSEIERRVLKVTKSLVSSYGMISDFRAHELKREFGYTLTQIEEARTNLISKGLLDRRKAITIKGKNRLELP